MCSLLFVICPYLLESLKSHRALAGETAKHLGVNSKNRALAGIRTQDLLVPAKTGVSQVEVLRDLFFWRSPSHGAQPLGLPDFHQSSHQCAQARPAHLLSPNFARHLRLTNQAALLCQGMGRGGGGAAKRTVKTRIVHTSVRRPAHRTPRPQNLHSDPDLQIRQPCGVRGRGGAGGGAAGRTPERVL